MTESSVTVNLSLKEMEPFLDALAEQVGKFQAEQDAAMALIHARLNQLEVTLAAVVSEARSTSRPRS